MNIFRRLYEQFKDEWNRGFNYLLRDKEDEKLAKIVERGMEEDGTRNADFEAT